MTCGSVSCLHIVRVDAGKASANIRCKRSKHEIELFDLLNITFNNIQHNTIIADGWDADIVLPNQKIAVLWNGPWHYQNMLGLKHSLKQVHTRDRIKRKIFRNLGWKVLIFEDRYWTPKTVSKVVEAVGFEPTMWDHHAPL